MHTYWHVRGEPEFWKLYLFPLLTRRLNCDTIGRATNTSTSRLFTFYILQFYHLSPSHSFPGRDMNEKSVQSAFEENKNEGKRE